MGRLRAGTVCAAFVIVGLVGGCDGESAQDVTEPAPTSASAGDSTVASDSGFVVDGPLVIAPECTLPVANACDPGDALLEGVLVLEAECAFIEFGAGRYAMLWQHGVAWDPTAQQLITAEGESMRSGDAIASGGGEGRIANLAVYYPGQPVPSRLEACAAQPDTAGFWIGYASPVADGADDPTSGAADPDSSVACGSSVETLDRDLPAWTEASGVPDNMPGVLSDSGAIVAYPFARPLLIDPQPGDPNPKVLLYARDDIDEIAITMELDGRRIESTRHLNGTPNSFPGYLEVDDPGCWNVTISYGDTTDTLSVLFVDA